MTPETKLFVKFLTAMCVVTISVAIALVIFIR